MLALRGVARARLASTRTTVDVSYELKGFFVWSSTSNQSITRTSMKLYSRPPCKNRESLSGNRKEAAFLKGTTTNKCGTLEGAGRFSLVKKRQHYTVLNKTTPESERL